MQQTSQYITITEFTPLQKLNCKHWSVWLYFYKQSCNFPHDCDIIVSTWNKTQPPACKQHKLYHFFRRSGSSWQQRNLNFRLMKTVEPASRSIVSFACCKYIQIILWIMKTWNLKRCHMSQNNTLRSHPVQLISKHYTIWNTGLNIYKLAKIVLVKVRLADCGCYVANS